MGLIHLLHYSPGGGSARTGGLSHPSHRGPAKTAGPPPVHTDPVICKREDDSLTDCCRAPSHPS
eukprot:2120001-Prorocentrum_lima.AAC.1